ncbi:MAG: signal peptide peptidase SppA [Syntrophales bacterium]
MRRHPVIFGIFLLFAVGILFFLFMFGISRLGGERKSFASSEKIGVVNVKGIITDSKSIVDQISRYSDDGKIKAVVIRIDSPGGGVAASQEIYDAVTNLKKKKKTVVSMGSVAASGGYYIACAADRIVANPGTVTGSIGAIMHFSNVEDTLKKIGVRSSVVKSGKYKDSGSPLREMTPEEKLLFQGVINDIYEQFVETVSKARKISREKMKDIADGRIFTGRQAQKLGLVDTLGDMSSAIDTAAGLAGIKGKPEVVYPKEKGFTIWRYIADELSSAVVRELRGEMKGTYFLSRDHQLQFVLE